MTDAARGTAGGWPVRLRCPARTGCRPGRGSGVPCSPRWQSCSSSAESAEAYIAPFADNETAREIVADAPGGGYVYPEGENLVTAQWACGGQIPPKRTVTK
jgi:hypothetical protein